MTGQGDLMMGQDGTGRQLFVMWRAIGESDRELVCISSVALDGVLKGSGDRPIWWERGAEYESRCCLVFCSRCCVEKRLRTLKKSKALVIANDFTSLAYNSQSQACLLDNRLWALIAHSAALKSQMKIPNKKKYYYS